MIEATVYAAATGKIDRVLTLRRELINSQLRPGEAWLEGRGDRLKEAVDLSADPPRIVPKPDARTLDERRRDRLAELAAVRWQRETAGIVVDGMAVRTDRTSQGMIAGALAGWQLSPESSFDWKAADGWVSLSGEALVGVARAVAGHVQACFSRERALAEIIQASAAPESVGIDEGWP